MNEKACEEIYPAYGKFNEQAVQLLKTLEGKKIKTIQSELHKIRIYVSDQQVNKKMKKLGCFSYDDGNFSVEEIANLFNYSAMRIYQFIYLEKDNLPYEKVNKKKYSINIDSFFRWLENNHSFNTQGYKIGSLPNEPEWLKERVKKDKEKRHIKSEQDKVIVANILTCRTQGMKNCEIEKRLNLSHKQFRKYVDKYILNDKEKIKQYKPIIKIAFTEKELEEMAALYHQGKKITHIAAMYSRDKNITGRKLKAYIASQK